MNRETFQPAVPARPGPSSIGGTPPAKPPRGSRAWRWFATVLGTSLLALAQGAHGQAPFTLTKLYGFSPVAGPNRTNPDGGYPLSGVIQGSDGNFYGATYVGGGNGAGTIFQLTPTGKFTTLHSFSGGGAVGGLLQGKDGNFYGTTSEGGSQNVGAIFRLTPAGIYTVLHDFNGSDGSNPSASLVQGGDGNFYGTTTAGGAFGGGTVFGVTPTGLLTTLYASGENDDGGILTSLLQGSDGNFYGITMRGPLTGRQEGTVFRLTPGGVVTTLHAFSALDDAGHNPDGEVPQSNLVQGSDGNLYGSTASGGAKGAGTIFRITPGGVLTTLHDFDEAEGQFTSLLQGLNGNFYGSAEDGGAGGGSIFEITPAGVFTSLHEFNGGGGDGIYPTSGMIQGKDGNLYGTTLESATGSTGSVYRFTLPPPPAPAVTSGASASGQAGVAFSYQITASNKPTAYAANGLPSGLSVDADTGLISGTPTVAGTFPVGLSATNAGGTGRAALTLTLAATTPTVSLVATIPQVIAGTDNFAEFTLALSAAQDHDVVINLLVKGSAVNGTDYVLIKTSKKIKAGRTTKPIKITPLGAGPGEGGKRVVTLLLAPGDGYIFGTTGKVKVRILGQ